ncbi:hypothetical protein KAR91_85700 [Candidatus Pacearchaeota archaeon]|nr:hypothetical protein [Candidatus Pacearchaeota archaeon]
MALIKFMGGIGAMSGKIGANVFSRNRSGAYVRGWAKPVNTNTARQQAVRQFMQSLSSRWSNTLTALQREEWEAYANAVLSVNRLGETIQLTGMNWYVGNNSVVLSAGGTIIDDGPAVLNKPNADSLFDVVIDEANQEISVTFDVTQPWVDQDAGRMLVSMGTPVNPTRNFFAGPYRIAGAISGSSTVPPTSPQVLTAPFAVQETQKAFVQARIVEEDARVSQFFRNSGIVTA